MSSCWSLTAAQLAELKSVGIVQPPVWLVSKSSAMARLIKNILDTYLGSGKEELVNYFTEWCNISQGELEGAITGLANHQYDHMDINASVDKITVFTRLMSQLFNQLSRLEYIGKRKRLGHLCERRGDQTERAAATAETAELFSRLNQLMLMQQVLNTNDRNTAFLKFLGFFVVTVVIVVVAVYFDYRLPTRENKVLLDEVNLQRQQDAGPG